MRPFIFGVLFLLFLVSIAVFPILAQADQAEELRQQIGARQNEIEKLDQIIAEQEKQLAATAKQANTLQNTVDAINLSVQKLNNQINKTETEIKSATLELEQLNLGIQQTTGSIGNHEIALREMMRELADQSQQSWPEILVRHRYLSDFLAAEDQMIKLQSALATSAHELKTLKTDLGVRVVDIEETKTRLSALKNELADQQKITAAERAKQQALLAETKNQEANYQKLLAEKRAEKAAFEKELRDFESRLTYTLNPLEIPQAGQRILSPPLDNIYITQPFGNTAFAAAGAYNGNGHPGVDFRASVGTPVKAVLAGIVSNVESLENVSGCGYGRWVLIKHDNGLETLYAHLSIVSVVKGQRVQTGTLLGYSGQTGYATGPHLHLGLFAPNSTSINKFTCKSGKSVTLPTAAFNAFLNPMLYF